MAYGVELVSLIAPTSHERIGRIARQAQGFIYCVSSLGVTGEQRDAGTAVGDMVAQLRAVTQLPCAVGFGISTPQQYGWLGSMEKRRPGLYISM